MDDKFELKMYVLVPYNINDKQKGIQEGARQNENDAGRNAGNDS
jgi:hypothetical protein